jgi:hypothetical protein
MQLNEVNVKDQFSDWDSRITEELYNLDEVLEINISTSEEEESFESENVLEVVDEDTPPKERNVGWNKLKKVI